MDESRANQFLIKPTLGNKLGILFMTFVVMVMTVGALRGLIGAAVGDGRSALLVSSALQALLAFMLPAWLAAILCSDCPMRYVGVSIPVCRREFAGVVIIMAVSLPTLNFIVDWNESLTLPTGMSAIEQTMRRLEDAAAETTAVILSTSSVGGLLSGILVIGVITGIGEEAFFRAGLQKAMSSSGLNRHAAVWTAAFVFSLLHFQFFGFVPRLLLGALFGYIYLWTDSLWVAASAHALNNSVVVVTSWLSCRGHDVSAFESLGTGGSFAGLVAGVSAVLTAAFIIFLWRRFFNTPSATVKCK